MAGGDQAEGAPVNLKQIVQCLYLFTHKLLPYFLSYAVFQAIEMNKNYLMAFVDKTFATFISLSVYGEDPTESCL